jgi:hypothetical protein
MAANPEFESGTNKQRILRDSLTLEASTGRMMKLVKNALHFQLSPPDGPKKKETG